MNRSVFFFTSILLLFTTGLVAQSTKYQFGDISPEERTMTQYAKDPDAKAVVLFDLGDTYFFDSENGYDIRFTRMRRVKIFDPSDESLAEVSIPFYHDGYGKTEVIKSIQAKTYNFDGKQLISVKPVDPSQIYEEVINEFWSVKKFIFPDLRPGSIIEYKYVFETPFHFNLPDWTFQDKIPTIYSEYKVSMIPFYEYSMITQGTSRFDVQKSIVSDKKRQWGNVVMNYGSNVGSGIEFQDYVHTFGLKDVPAFKDESFITSINDYIIKMDFQLSKFFSPRGGSREIISTWPALIDGLLKEERFGKFQSGSARFSKKILEELAVSDKSEMEKFDLIVSYVKENFVWSGHDGKYSTQSPKEFLTKKEGNAADINLFLISLLEQAGLEAKPLIISTRNHGRIRSEYPFLHYFNYVVAAVRLGDTYVLTDGTEPLLGNYRIPPRCINDSGLMIDKEDVFWVDLSVPIVSKDIIQIYTRIDTLSMIAESSIINNTTEFIAFEKRKKYKDNQSLLIKELKTLDYNDIDEVSIKNFEDRNRPYLQSYKIKSELSYLGENLIIDPFMHFGRSKNPLIQPTRDYPVDMTYSSSKVFVINIEKIPGYEISELPRGLKISNDLVEIYTTYNVSDSHIEVKGEYTFKKAVYNPKDYKLIKYCMDEIVKHFNEKLVLEKL